MYPTKHSTQSPPRPRPLNRTNPLAWFIAICCTILWLTIILGGLAILIIYLFFRPLNPHLDIPQATLNAAYLDADPGANATRLNADLTLLSNFSNPNHKVDVVFILLELELYFGGVLVGAVGVEPFAERRGESVLRSVHMVGSEVELGEEGAAEWRRREEGEGVVMEVRGRMRVKLELGGWLKFSYWLHSTCRIVMGPPPAGVLQEGKCRTKR